ncbi:hypothetical protein [Lacticaseibacillus hegangensis]|uniref:Uncharacterized protein n=1 Tax=Lacticaseibacillus hegangensis TaxID=2486010 RepID=A0ABW4CXJ8_9LACO|nr:hypothetical protein [Lacticaseibacillus hegangensis]
MMSAGFGLKGQYQTRQDAHPASNATRERNAELHARAFDRVSQAVGGGKVALGALAIAVVLMGAMSATL